MDFLARQCETRGLEIFYPRIRVRTVNPRARKVRPYFPGYIFVQADLSKDQASSLQWLPGASGLVSYGNIPASVPDDLIDAIRKRVEEVNVADRKSSSLKEMNRGDIVTIKMGPFAGHEAIFDVSVSGNERVQVLLKLINKQHLHLELPAGQIQLKSKNESPRKSTK